MDTEDDAPARERGLLDRRPGLGGALLLAGGLFLVLACSTWRTPYSRQWTFGDWAANSALAVVGVFAALLAVTGAVFLIKATRRRP